MASQSLENEHRGPDERGLFPPLGSEGPALPGEHEGALTFDLLPDNQQPPALEQVDCARALEAPSTPVCAAMRRGRVPLR